jgi:hypothetical protein
MAPGSIRPNGSILATSNQAEKWKTEK